MKIMAFKSAPPAPETTPTPQTSLDDEDTQADSVSASSARGAGRTRYGEGGEDRRGPHCMLRSRGVRAFFFFLGAFLF